MSQLAESRAVKLNHSKAILINMFIIVLILACVVPGLRPQTVPTANPDSLSTLIAGTAAAANTQTAAASSPTLSPSPVPTHTALPVITGTPGSVFSAEGTALLPDENGSTVFIDQAVGYRLHIPAGWLLVRINEQELSDAFSLPAASDPRMQNFLRQVQKNDPKLFRLFGADTLPEHFQSGFVTNFNVFWDPNNTDSLEQLIGTLKEQLPRTPLNPSITFAAVSFTSSRVPIGTIESTSTLFSSEGWPTNLYQKQVVFRLTAGALTVVLSTTQEQKNTYLPGFDTMVDQIVLLGQ